MVSNELAPHKTVIWIKSITYQLLSTGECSGIPLNEKKSILQIDGEDKDIAIKKTEKFLEDIKKCLEQK